MLCLGRLVTVLSKGTAQMRKKITNIHEATEKVRPDAVRRVNEHISIAVVYAETEEQLQLAP